MARIIFISGGCRSGKSHHALQAALQCQGPYFFLATCPKIDQEMESRISKHQQERDPRIWTTLEEELDLFKIFKELSKEKFHKTIVVDCLSLWINNLMYHSQLQNRSIQEDQVEQLCQMMLSAVEEIHGNVFFVTNEVGMGIVPVNKEARLYRDLLGRCNRVVAEKADHATVMISGLPLKLK